MYHKLAEYLTSQRGAIDSALSLHLPKSSVPGADTLNQALSYALFPGGKRWRPVFTILGAALIRQSDFTPDSEVLKIACAVEFLHTSSLILDDLPSMDDADQRRGKATLHLVFGENIAILTALSLLNQSYALLAAVRSSDVAQKLVSEICFCIGSNGMIGGQAVELHGDDGFPCTSHIGGRNLKTTALTRLMMTSGAITCNARDNEISALARFGECLGLAYQVYDDLLDVCDEGVVSGKTAHQDARLSRPSAVSDLGIDGTVKLVGDTIEEAIAELQRNFENRLALHTIVSATQYLFRDLKRYSQSTSAIAGR